MKETSRAVFCFMVVVLIVSFGTNASAQKLIKSEYWTHGNSIHLEPQTTMTVDHFGFGGLVTISTTSSGQGGWVHFSIPTPVIFDRRRGRLTRIMVVYDGTALIDQVDVWNGKYRIGSEQNLKLTGEGVYEFTFVPPNRPRLTQAIGISVHVVNCFEEVCGRTQMLFPTAGAELIHKRVFVGPAP